MPSKKQRRPSRTKKQRRPNRTKIAKKTKKTKRKQRKNPSRLHRTKQIINILSANHGLRDIKRKRRPSRSGKEYIRRWITSRRVS